MQGKKRRQGSARFHWLPPGSARFRWLPPVLSTTIGRHTSERPKSAWLNPSARAAGTSPFRGGISPLPWLRGSDAEFRNSNLWFLNSSIECAASGGRRHGRPGSARSFVGHYRRLSGRAGARPRRIRGAASLDEKVMRIKVLFGRAREGLFSEKPPLDRLLHGFDKMWEMWYNSRIAILHGGKHGKQ